MRKSTVITAALAAAAGISAMVIVPNAVESSAPAAETIKAQTREYCDTVSGSGAVAFLGQQEITSSLPLVVEKFSVEVGDEVSAGDEIATVDKSSSAALIQSLGQIRMLAVAAADLETAIAMIPETIVSDCSGKVISTAPIGTAIQSGSAVACISQNESLSVQAAVSELDIAKVELGQKAVITLAAYPNETFSGTVTEISQTARNQYSGAVLETVVDITVTPDTLDERMKSGFSADVEIALGEPREVFVVPYAAIGQDNEGEYVFVYENGKSVRKNITTGAEFSDGAEVMTGISSGDIIFKEPEKIADKSYIRLAEDLK